MTPQRDPSIPIHERDFTAGLLHDQSHSFIGSTGEKMLDEKIIKLAKEISGVSDQNLLAEMLVTAVRVSRGGITEGDFKTMNRSLKEMREASEVFYPYCKYRKVSIFGSARTDPEEAEYKAAVEFAKKMKKAGFMTITGAGPGIMAAGNEGAGRSDSFGLNINLPFESAANAFIAGDEKLIDFHFFFTRKLCFVKESDAVVAFPGGFGTMDEIFETLTLVQTGKASICPLVLIDAKGGTYWKFWLQFVKEHLGRQNLISESDFSLFKVTDDLDEAVEEVTRFYSNFHSYRYVGDKLSIRIRKKLNAKQINLLNEKHSNVLKSGGFKQSDPLLEEGDEPELASLPRLIFRHRRKNFGELRELIDTINS